MATLWMQMACRPCCLPSPAAARWRWAAATPTPTSVSALTYKATATAAQEGTLRFWNLPATPLTYSSGGNGYTARLHLFASGGKQQFNWKTQRGYLSSPQDVRNQEFTVYVRVHEPLTPLNAQVTLKIRGGHHSEKDCDAASCTMMTFGPGGPSGITRFAK